MIVMSETVKSYASIDSASLSLAPTCLLAQHLLQGQNTYFSTRKLSQCERETDLAWSRLLFYCAALYCYCVNVQQGVNLHLQGH